MGKQLIVPSEPSERMFETALSNGYIARHNIVLLNLREVLRLAYIEMTRTGAAELKEPPTL